MNEMNFNVFTYGSLMFPQVWERVVHGHYQSAKATVTGYARFAIIGELYPGMVVRADAAVQGVVYFDVGPRDMAALDAFEGAHYRRDGLNATLDCGTVVAAGAYIFINTPVLSDMPWLPETFQIQRFMQTYRHDKPSE
jgi:gamma-glutamylcyclotransferase (GGCT)/AIG2-like uncharacterized protein YtfP